MTPGQGVVPRTHIASTEAVPLQAPGILTNPEAPSSISGPQPSGESFGNMLTRMVDEVNTKQQIASDAVANLQAGGNVSLHQAVIAMEEASVSFQLMVEVRNKLLESYQEIMRMQI